MMTLTRFSQLFFLSVLLCSLWAQPLFATVLDKGVLLVARDTIDDPRFRGHTILLIQHDARGSAGLVLDRTSRLPLGKVLGEDSILSGGKMLAYGGPVEPKTLLALVRVRKHPPEPSDDVLQGLFLTGAGVLESWPDFSEEVIDYRIFSGYAGWAQGQLVKEIERGDWDVLPADEEIILSDAGGNGSAAGH